MEIKDIYKKIEKNCPPQYRINEIIPFGYPLREIKIKAQVSKSPEKAIQQMYSVMLRTIKIGYNQEPLLVKFLGLNEDDFILNELYTLREMGYLDFVSQQWVVTPQGEKFLEDATILKISEEEEFTFYLDCYTNAILSKKNLVPSKQKTHNKLDPKFNFEHKSSEILNNRNQDIQDIYKEENTDAYLIDYADTLLFDKKIDTTYCLIEYFPLSDEKEPYIEIRNFNNDFSIEKRLTKLFQEEYPSILYVLSDSDREKIVLLNEKNNELITTFSDKKSSLKEPFEELSVWQTKEKFVEAIKTAKEKLLIESPWIKKATLQYTSDIENALKRKVKIIILFGIETNDEHDNSILEKLHYLKDKYKELFYLIHLPTHFLHIGNKKLSGSHRKLIIKDDDYYLQGSFNFLSFNKREGEKVANESSFVVTTNITQKWKNILSEYELKHISL